MARRTCTARGIVLLAALLLWAAGAASPAGAGGLDDARSRGRLLAGVRTDLPPFGYRDPSGEPAGFDVDVARYLARALFEEDGRLEAVPVTSGSRIPFHYSEWVDMIVAGMTVTDERRQVLEFSDPYFVSASLLLVPGGSRVRGTSDLAGKTVAVVEGSVQAKDLPRLAPAARTAAYATVTEAVRAVESGKADALCEDDVEVRELARRHRALKVAGKPLLPRPYAIALRKGDVATLRWVNEKLAAMRKDGTYVRLRGKYFGGAPGKGGKP